MARSSYIYVVTLNGKVHSAYTVKHELQSGLPKNGDGIEVFRVKDNPWRDDPKPINITQEFYEE